jgi:predicted GIY-YIG superfamily endonuclease
MRRVEKRFLYILRSLRDPSQRYVGITSNVTGRLEWHNHGPCGHTPRYRPWSLVVSMEFPTETASRRFESYLKSGSGRAFAKRHFGAADARTKEGTHGE